MLGDTALNGFAKRDRNIDESSSIHDEEFERSVDELEDELERRNKLKFGGRFADGTRRGRDKIC